MNRPIPVEQALGLLQENALTLPSRQVPLSEAAGCRLAEPVISRVTQPPAAVSAMDGFAVRLADVRAPGATLAVIGTAPAGTPFTGLLKPGQAVRIFTGGHLPPGADHIVIQEDAEISGDQVRCLRGYAASEFVRAAGIDFSEGERLLNTGAILTPAALSLVAAANHGHLQVTRRPRVGILANGDELRPPGSELRPGQVINANAAGLSALIASWGGDPVDLGIASDSMASILDHVQSADVDLFVPVGGASVGDHDHMRAAFRESGFEPIFEKIAVKPGKPTWFSRRGAQRVLGLPGNPASAFVCAHLFVRPLLTGHFVLPSLTATLAAPLPANGAREEFLRARVHVSPQGLLLADAAPNQDSSLLKPFLTANGLIRRPAHAPAGMTGAAVPVLLIGQL
ncbi:molybdopterin biosynthesis protein MoeA [Hyphomonas polymorpha PS728]|uniref:Molybdopterin molybdenumtransferase n=1 Tax=Hyphomonas polymorpha PS728 TaxID=1280954 RepID=A0A062V9Y2_9PROT|nr:molybdopterin molybdotransferase MoeA [Hyphomonas polymorpha]KCZ99106.1 molybdopterin biosynthesis protein MoeA [Hyphomonas polymorpha PS728]